MSGSITPALMIELESAAQGRLLGRFPQGSDPLFLTPAGSGREGNRRNALRALEKLPHRAEIPKQDDAGRRIDIHALRHTAASRLASRSGAGLPVAEKLLGHTSPRLTAQVYTHLGGGGPQGRDRGSALRAQWH